jgi:hypothetical protein
MSDATRPMGETRKAWIDAVRLHGAREASSLSANVLRRDTVSAKLESVLQVETEGLVAFYTQLLERCLSYVSGSLPELGTMLADRAALLQVRVALEPPFPEASAKTGVGAARGERQRQSSEPSSSSDLRGVRWSLAEKDSDSVRGATSSGGVLGGGLGGPPASSRLAAHAAATLRGSVQV